MLYIGFTLDWQTKFRNEYLSDLRVQPQPEKTVVFSANRAPLGSNLRAQHISHSLRAPERTLWMV